MALCMIARAIIEQQESHAQRNQTKEQSISHKLTICVKKDHIECRPCRTHGSLPVKGASTKVLKLIGRKWILGKSIKSGQNPEWDQPPPNPPFVVRTNISNSFAVLCKRGWKVISLGGGGLYLGIGIVLSKIIFHILALIRCKISINNLER